MSETRSEQARRVADQLQGKDWVNATFEASELLRIMANDMEAARTPSPDAARLLATAQEALVGLDRISMAIEADMGPGTYCQDIQFAIKPLRSAVTEHEAAGKGGAE